MRTALVLASIALALSAVPLTGAVNELTGCPAVPETAGWFPAHTAVVAAPGEALAVTVRVDEAATFFFHAGMGYHDTVVAGQQGRSAVMSAIEDANGARTSLGGLLGVPYGADVALGPVSLAAPGAPGACGAYAAGSSIALQPGTYRLIGGFASEDGNSGALYVPHAISILAVETGVSLVISEAALDCDVKVRAAALGFAHETLSGCDGAWSVENAALWLFTVGAYWDADHYVYWTPAGGERERAFFEYGSGPAGTYTIDVPQYSTTLASGFVLPVPTDGDSAGIFGVIADV